MPEQRLNQILAIEKTLKGQVEKDITGIYHAVQKPALFEGKNRTYQPLKDDGEKLPPENIRVQQQADALLKQATNRWAELLNATCTKDVANTTALADVVVDGTPILTNVPATFLLTFEKKLIDLHTLIKSLPTLDPAEEWHQDANDKLWKSQPLKRLRTAKNAKVIELTKATDKHPATAQLVHEDLTVGTWEEQRVSGAIPEVRKRELLAKVEKLQAAVKSAIQAANQAKADPQYPGPKVFEWLYAS